MENTCTTFGGPTAWRLLLTDVFQGSLYDFIVIECSGSHDPVNERPEGGNEPEYFRPPQQSQCSSDRQAHGLCNKPALGFVNTDPLNALVEGELDHRRFTPIKSCVCGDRQGARQGHRGQPIGGGIRVPQGYASGYLLENFLRRNEVYWKFVDEVQQIHPGERDQGSGVDDKTVSHRGRI